MAGATMKIHGMTWDHPRGHAPMVATAAAYARAHPGIVIEWEQRSLQAFADQPVGELAARYDLIVIDHPHLGDAVKAGCLVALDEQGREDELSTLAAQSIGPSHLTYCSDGHQWALAIDAAAQVAAFRPDRLPGPRAPGQR